MDDFEKSILVFNPVYLVTFQNIWYFFQIFGNALFFWATYVPTVTLQRRWHLSCTVRYDHTQLKSLDNISYLGYMTVKYIFPASCMALQVLKIYRVNFQWGDREETHS